MIKNFHIKDATLFFIYDHMIDMRGNCSLLNINFLLGAPRRVEMMWKIEGSNRNVQFLFDMVSDFVVKGRDFDYPIESGSLLAIAGFSNGVLSGDEDEFYVEPTFESDYMSFVMDDGSAFLIKAESVSMHMI